MSARIAASFLARFSRTLDTGSRVPDAKASSIVRCSGSLSICVRKPGGMVECDVPYRFTCSLPFEGPGGNFARPSPFAFGMSQSPAFALTPETASHTTSQWSNKNDYHSFFTSAERAALCSASCFDFPEPSATNSLPKNTPTVKCLSWSGPLSARILYVGVIDARSCASS